MTEENSTAGDLDTVLIALFAATTSAMMTLWAMLHSNSAVAEVTRGCDIRQYQRSMSGNGENVYTFESYVEAETSDGELFCWALDITRGPSGWELQRYISKQLKEGAQTVKDFDDFKFGTFPELASKHPELLAEFVKSADNFDFNLEP